LVRNVPMTRGTRSMPSEKGPKPAKKKAPLTGPKWDYRKPENIPPVVAYNEVPVHFIEWNATLTAETEAQADLAFETLRPLLKKSKLFEKRMLWRKLFHAGKKAWHPRACLAVSRAAKDRAFRIKVQLVRAALAVGFFHLLKSKPGSPKMSRLFPTNALADRFDKDPWTVEPEPMKSFVKVRDRETKEEIPFDPEHPVAKETQRVLELVNAVNSRYEITYRPWDDWCGEFLDDTRRLRPVLYARFTDDFTKHGRMYTGGKFGHQSLRTIERATILFDGERATELDIVCMHPRLLYHLNGMDYRGDLYAIWGPDTTGSMRLMAKVATNCLINAVSDRSAESACNNAMRTKTKNGERKTGKAREKAVKLYEAWLETGFKFREVLKKVRQTHKRLPDDVFGNDLGIVLQRSDSLWMLDVLHHFASHGVPCLPCHDSCVVPVSSEREAKRSMMKFYKDRFGFHPVIKKSW
jgi:hypothetical protein